MVIEGGFALLLGTMKTGIVDNPTLMLTRICFLMGSSILLAGSYPLLNNLLSLVHFNSGVVLSVLSAIQNDLVFAFDIRWNRIEYDRFDRHRY